MSVRYVYGTLGTPGNAPSLSMVREVRVVPGEAYAPKTKDPRRVALFGKAGFHVESSGAIKDRASPWDPAWGKLVVREVDEGLCGQLDALDQEIAETRSRLLRLEGERKNELAALVARGRKVRIK